LHRRSSFLRAEAFGRLCDTLRTCEQGHVCRAIRDDLRVLSIHGRPAVFALEALSSTVRACGRKSYMHLSIFLYFSCCFCFCFCFFFVTLFSNTFSTAVDPFRVRIEWPKVVGGGVRKGVRVVGRRRSKIKATKTLLSPLVSIQWIVLGV